MGRHLAVKQEINLELMKLAEKLGVDYAYPVSIDFNAPLVKSVAKGDV